MTLYTEFKSIHRLNIPLQVKIDLCLARLCEVLYGEWHGFKENKRIPFKIRKKQ